MYIKITRPVNVAITGCAVALGVWIAVPGEIGANPLITAALSAAAMAAAAYGNVINDIIDVKSDRISHPNRPLADGSMTPRAAAVLAAALAAASLASALAASPLHLAAAFAPIVLLTLYSTRLKRTRIIGNAAIASLTAYALIFGAITHPQVKILFAPAMLAFLLNFCREIVKDVEDAEGDRAAGWRTSAELSPAAIKAVLTGAAAVYAAIMLAPSIVLKDFGAVYTWICVTVVAPLHIYWVILALKSRGGVKKHAGRIGLILKLEMVAGLVALACDRGAF